MSIICSVPVELLEQSIAQAIQAFKKIAEQLRYVAKATVLIDLYQIGCPLAWHHGHPIVTLIDCDFD